MVATVDLYSVLFVIIISIEFLICAFLMLLSMHTSFFSFSIIMLYTKSSLIESAFQMFMLTMLFIPSGYVAVPSPAGPAV